MSPSGDTATLRAALEEEVERYERALQIAEGLPDVVEQGQDAQPHLRSILTDLSAIVQIEHRIAEPKQRWLQSAEEPNPELEAYRIRLITLIGQLQERLGRAEREASLRQSQLLPKLDSLLRAQRMRQAYGAVFNQTAGHDPG